MMMMMMMMPWKINQTHIQNASKCIEQQKIYGQMDIEHTYKK